MTKDTTTTKSEAAASDTEVAATAAKKPAAKKPATKTKPTKADKVLNLLKRTNGATLGELARATGWQDHSVRGFLSGTVKKRMGFDVISEKDDKGTRRYRIVE